MHESPHILRAVTIWRSMLVERDSIHLFCCLERMWYFLLLGFKTVVTWRWVAWMSHCVWEYTEHQIIYNNWYARHQNLYTVIEPLPWQCVSIWWFWSSETPSPASHCDLIVHVMHKLCPVVYNLYEQQALHICLCAPCVLNIPLYEHSNNFYCP